ncbi:MAG: aspartate aminotransferase family protein [Candidatus Brocadiaceae bacterium]|nr:aspartate aminotransferase family protein [Candidatus Brocadiaceae bacterium]
MHFDEVRRLFDKHVVANYARQAVAFVRGAGSYLWDTEGNRYIDLMPGWGTTLLGHCHPKVVTAVQRQAAMLLHVDNTFYIPPQGQLAQAVSERSFGGKCFFCNSGAEANEAALKLARIYAEESGRYKVISMLHSFHGRTMAAIRATGQPAYHRGVPHVEGFCYVPMNDLDAVKEAVDDETCAVIVEPIQGEGGVNIATQEFMEGLRALCDQKEMLLIFDEVQTGVGRTGDWFAYQNYGVTPDVMTLAKALASGVPIGAMVARPEVAERLVPGTHASTFGGNPLACAAGLATFQAIEDEDLLSACRRVGEHIHERLTAMAGEFDIVREVRGRGVMWGVDLTRPAGPVFQYCLEQRVRLNCTHTSVLRILPAMNVPRDVLDVGLDVLRDGLARAQAGDI